MRLRGLAQRIFSNVSLALDIQNGRRDVWGVMGEPLTHVETATCELYNDVCVGFLQDFTIDGKVFDDANDDNYEDAYRNKLIYVTGKSPPNRAITVSYSTTPRHFFPQ